MTTRLDRLGSPDARWVLRRANDSHGTRAQRRRMGLLGARADPPAAPRSAPMTMRMPPASSRSCTPDGAITTCPSTCRRPTRSACSTSSARSTSSRSWTASAWPTSRWSAPPGARGGNGCAATSAAGIDPLVTRLGLVLVAGLVTLPVAVAAGAGGATASGTMSTSSFVTVSSTPARPPLLSPDLASTDRRSTTAASTAAAAASAPATVAPSVAATATPTSAAVATTDGSTSRRRRPASAPGRRPSRCACAPPSTTCSPVTTGWASPIVPTSTSTTCSRRTARPVDHAAVPRRARSASRPGRPPRSRRRRHRRAGDHLGEDRGAQDHHAEDGPGHDDAGHQGPPRRRHPSRRRRPSRRRHRPPRRSRPRPRRRRRRPRRRRGRTPATRSPRSSATCGPTISRTRRSPSPPAESNLNPAVRNYCCFGLFQIYFSVHAGLAGRDGRHRGHAAVRPAGQRPGGADPVLPQRRLGALGRLSHPAHLPARADPPCGGGHRLPR